jgi:hypothetical protein
MVTKQKMPMNHSPPAKSAARVEPAGNDAWGTAAGIHALVYGQSGSGKTTLAATFPAPILWLVCSGGNRPGELKSIDTAANRKRITPRIVSTVIGFAELIADAGSHATVVLDHASGLSDLILREILGLEKLPEQKGWGMATQQQYGQLGLQCKEAFRSLLNLPQNVVILAQERTFGGRDDGMDPDIVHPTVGAALTPSVTGWLNPACDYIMQTFKKPKYKEVTAPGGKGTMMLKDRGVEYCLRVGPHELFQTKFRRPWDGTPLPESIVLDDPGKSYEKIVSLIEGAST